MRVANLPDFVPEGGWVIDNHHGGIKFDTGIFGSQASLNPHNRAVHEDGNHNRNGHDGYESHQGIVAANPFHAPEPTHGIRMLRVAVAVWCEASVACTVKVLVPEVVGVPEITPVPEVKVRPAGKVPLVTTQIRHGLAPVEATSGCE